MNVPADDDEEIMLFTTVYCSRATKSFGDDDLAQLVAAAQRHNAKESITGWLVYSNGIFFQWLEGAREHVTRLMASITADARHNTIVNLGEAEEVRSRMFSEWNMELVSRDDIRSVLLDAIDAATESSNLEVLQRILKEFDAKAHDVAN